MQEIERKFLLASVPAGVREWVPIRQGYLAVGTDAAVRVRQHGDRCWLTCKRGVGMVRDEWEVELTADQWETLWPATTTARVEKSRGHLAVDDAIAVVDVFHGDLAGLVLAEVEFRTEQDARAFVPPAWMAHDVTDDPRYGNRSLAVAGLPAPGGETRA